MKNLYPSLLARAQLLLLCMCFLFKSHAAITVDSVRVTSSTCPNNGTATIYAHSSSGTASLLYNVVSGPTLYPLQNSNVFISLYPGNYTARVHDVNSFDSVSVNFTITGSYQNPVVSATASAPLCINGNNGQIVGHLQPGTGLGPYQWQMYSPVTGALQQSDTFNGLGTGSYIIRVTDACNVSRAVSIALDTGGTGLAFTNFGPTLFYAGCKTVIMYSFFTIYNSKSYLPYWISATSSTGTVTKQFTPIPVDTFHQIPPLYEVIDTITGVEFGKPLPVRIYDICNVSISLTPDTFPPFLPFIKLVQDTCGNYLGDIALTQFSQSDYFDVEDLVPVTVTLQNAQTNQVIGSYTTVDSTGMQFPCNNCPLFPSQPNNEPVILTVKDACGDSIRQTLNWPSAPGPSCGTYSFHPGCIDSTTNEDFYTSGFGSYLTVELLSGPAVTQSTDPRWPYRDTLIYPIYTSGTGPQLTLGNLPLGHYTYKISDNCGHSITDSFDVTAVYGLYLNTPVTSNCNGTSNVEISLPFGISTFIMHTIEGPDTLPIQLQIVNNQPVVQDLPEGIYGIHLHLSPSITPLLTGNAWCATIIDTVIVPAYNDSVIKSTYSVYCNGDIYLVLVADTSNGPPPFKYEVLHGPVTFTPQDSGVFKVNQYGTYLVGVFDSCGNEDTRYVTVDTGRFKPVLRNGGLCATGPVTLTETASPYFSYVWRAPDGAVYTGSSITIQVPGNDTGVYHITQYVNINGCTDSVHGTYTLRYANTFYQNIKLCQYDTLHVGVHTYTQAGVYTDTFATVYGCDSIEVTTVTMQPGFTTHINAYAVNGCQSGTVRLIATGGASYTWQPGNLTGDTITVTPPGVTTYVVIAADTSTCTASASFTVNPNPVVSLQADTAFVCGKTPATLCADQTGYQYLWNNDSTTRCITTCSPGNYHVVVTTNLGCTASSENGVIMVEQPPVIMLSQDTIYISQPLPGTIYQWFHNGSALAGATGYFIIASGGGSYSVQSMGPDSCAGGSNNIIITGIIDAGDDTDLKIGPNPTTGQLITESRNFTPQTVTIYDADGRLVSTMPFKNELDITALGSGVYFIEVRGVEGVVRRRVVKM